MSLAKRLLKFLGLSLLIQILGLIVFGYYIYKNKEQSLPPSIIQSLTKVDQKILEGVALQHKMNNETARNLIAYELLELNGVSDVEFLNPESVPQIIHKMELGCRKSDNSIQICLKPNHKDVYSFVPVKMNNYVLGYLKLGKSLSSPFVTSKEIGLVFFAIVASFLFNMSFILIFWLKYLKPDLHKLLSVIYSGKLDDSIESKEYLDIQSKIVESYKKIKEAEEERVTHARAIEREVLAKRVAHDSKSPLTAIKAGLNRIQIASNDKSLLQKATERLSAIISELSQGKNITKSKVELGEYIQDIVDEKRAEYRELPNISIIYQRSDINRITVDVVLGDLGRCLSNLINNAVEASENKRNVIKINLEVNGRSAVIKVEDSGVGIEQKKLEMILSGKMSSEKPEGSGIGLSSTQKFSKDHSGDFEIRSKLGIGTVVKITLPLCFNVIENGTIQIRGGTKVIVADDEKLIHIHWKRVLRDIPNKVEYYSSVEEIPELDFNTRYIVFSDYDFGASPLNGVDCYKKIKSFGADFDFYLVTGTDLSSIEANLIPNVIPKSALSSIGVRPVLDEKVILLLDDEEINHLNWRIEAERKGVEILSCYTSFEFFKLLLSIQNKNTPIYIDYELSEKTNGVEVAQKAADLGFQNIILTTGQEQNSISLPSYIQKIQGKEFPFL
ncbi:MAG: HAMP domain-containing histidine kinase [Bacteriovoracaceae bacterium]|nr:HAMP domain-containing histidine kinase [Bacteriovoracaceae bacterium]